MNSMEGINENALLELFDNYNKTNSNMCAILYNKANIYAVGYNSYMSHTRLFRKRLFIPSVHAEMNAVSNYIKTLVSPTRKRRKLNRVVLRKGSKGDFMDSKPCKHCITLLRSKLVTDFINLHKITFFEDGGYKTLSLHELENNHITKGWRRYEERRLHSKF